MKYILKKDLKRIFSNKRIVISLFVLPLVLIIGLYSLLGNQLEDANKDIQEHEKIIYIQNIPDGFQELWVQLNQGHSVKFNLIHNDKVVQIKNDILIGKVDLLVCFPENFIEVINSEINQNNIPDIETFYNPSEDYSVSAKQFFMIVIESYRQQLQSIKFGDISNINLFTIDIKNENSIIQDEQKAYGQLIGSMFTGLLIMMIFTSIINLCLDSMTGEKERGTLACLLLTPIKRWKIIVGKLFAIVFSSYLSAIVYLSAMLISLPQILSKLNTGVEINGSISAVQIIKLLFLLFCIVFLYSSIIMLIGVYSKTVKEGNAIVMPFYFLIILTGFMTMYNKETFSYQYIIPIYNGAITMLNIFTREITNVQLIISFISIIMMGVILNILSVIGIKNEKAIFNN